MTGYFQIYKLIAAQNLQFHEGYYMGACDF